MLRNSMVWNIIKVNEIHSLYKFRAISSKQDQVIEVFVIQDPSNITRWLNYLQPDIPTGLQLLPDKMQNIFIVPALQNLYSSIRVSWLIVRIALFYVCYWALNMK